MDTSCFSRSLLAATALNRASTSFTPVGAVASFPRATCGSQSPSRSGGAERASRRAKLFFYWPQDEEDLRMVLHGLDSTVTDCPDLIRPGYFHQSNSIVFYITANDSMTVRTIESIIFDDKFVRKHRQVVAFHHVGDQKLIVTRFNIFKDKPSKSLVQLSAGSNSFRTYFEDFPMEVLNQCYSTYHRKRSNIDPFFHAEFHLQSRVLALQHLSQCRP